MRDPALDSGQNRVPAGVAAAACCRSLSGRCVRS